MILISQMTTYTNLEHIFLGLFLFFLMLTIFYGIHIRVDIIFAKKTGLDRKRKTPRVGSDTLSHSQSRRSLAAYGGRSGEVARVRHVSEPMQRKRTETTNPTERMSRTERLTGDSGTQTAPLQAGERVTEWLQADSSATEVLQETGGETELLQTQSDETALLAEGIDETGFLMKKDVLMTHGEKRI